MGNTLDNITQAFILVPYEFCYGTLSDGGSTLDFDGGKYRANILQGGKVYSSGWEKDPVLAVSAAEALAMENA